MSGFKCSLCASVLDTVLFKLNLTISSHSCILLIDLIKDLVGGLNLMNYSICTECYNIINELDFLLVRQKQIYHKLIKYLCPGPKNQEGTTAFQKKECMNEKLLINPDLTTDFDGVTNEVLNKENIVNYEIIEKTENCTSNFNNQNSNEKELSTVQDSNLIETATRGKRETTQRKLYKCHCSKTFHKVHDFKKHLLSHENRKPFICDICGQSYKNRYSFKIHMEMHNGNNAFTCSYCDKSFTQKVALLRHLPLHTGDIPHLCDICGKTFVHHASFKIHKLSHSGEKPYKCNACGLSLICGAHLKRHMRVHTGEKNFACSVCGRKFAERYNLVSHEKLHVKGEVKKKRIKSKQNL